MYIKKRYTKREIVQKTLTITVQNTLDGLYRTYIAFLYNFRYEQYRIIRFAYDNIHCHTINYNMTPNFTSKTYEKSSFQKLSCLYMLSNDNSFCMDFEANWLTFETKFIRYTDVACWSSCLDHVLLYTCSTCTCIYQATAI